MEDCDIIGVSHRIMSQEFHTGTAKIVACQAIPEVVTISLIDKILQMDFAEHK